MAVFRRAKPRLPVTHDAFGGDLCQARIQFNPPNPGIKATHAVPRLARCTNLIRWLRCSHCSSSHFAKHGQLSANAIAFFIARKLPRLAINLSCLLPDSPSLERAYIPFRAHSQGDPPITPYNNSYITVPVSGCQAPIPSLSHHIPSTLVDPQHNPIAPNPHNRVLGKTRGGCDPISEWTPGKLGSRRRKRGIATVLVENGKSGAVEPRLRRGSL